MSRVPRLLTLLPCLILLGCGGHAGYVGDPARYEPDLYIVDGDGQSIATGSPFPRPLVVQIRDKSGRVLPSHIATFTAPSTGASGTFPDGTASAIVITDSNGKATTPAFTANATAGAYQVQVHSSYSGGTVLKFNLTNQ